jgi:hypothetical protein
LKLAKIIYPPDQWWLDASFLRPATPRHSDSSKYPTVPLHLTVEDARAALEAAGWFAGKELSW